MISKADWQASLAICSAIIGAGFASGREIVGFFSGFGIASWLGVAAASAGIGALVYVVLLLVRRTKAGSFPELYGSLMGVPCQDAMHVLHGLLCLITASSMLAAGAELGALTIPSPYSRIFGFLLTMAAALTAVCTGFRSLSMIGALLIPLTAAYFVSMIPSGSYNPAFSADGLLAAIPMGLLYAAFNAALSGGTLCMVAARETSPAGTAITTGLLMLLLLSCANGAMLRAGDTVMQMTMPSVALASRWGVFGYYASIIVLWLAVLTTLIAMLHSLRVQLSACMSRISSLMLAAGGAAVMAVCGFEGLVNVGYPLLGWICGFALVSLMLFLPEDQTLNQ